MLLKYRTYAGLRFIVCEHLTVIGFNILKFSLHDAFRQLILFKVTHFYSCPVPHLSSELDQINIFVYNNWEVYLLVV